MVLTIEGCEVGLSGLQPCEAAHNWRQVCNVAAGACSVLSKGGYARGDDPRMYQAWPHTRLLCVLQWTRHPLASPCNLTLVPVWCATRVRLSHFPCITSSGSLSLLHHKAPPVHLRAGCYPWQCSQGHCEECGSFDCRLSRLTPEYVQSAPPTMNH